MNGGIFNSTPISSRTSLIVKPLSAITEMPFPSFNFSINPDNLVSSTSEMEPTKSGDIKETAPFGVQAIRNLAVFSNVSKS